MAGDVKFRTEHDTMGPVDVPAHAYYGAQTMRAVQNFPIGDLIMPRPFIQALGRLKAAAAQVNMDLGRLDAQKGHAIVEAGREVATGKLDDQFPIGVFQTGSGTSTNMNVNEVIACRANELLSGNRVVQGDVHPNDDVNKGQSSNDMIPTAIHLSAMSELHNNVIPALAELETSLRKKACEFWPVIKTGRTHLQDATPIRLGQEFLGYADSIKLASELAQRQIDGMAIVALGGTAVGTGINTHPEFSRRVLEIVASETGLPIQETPYHFTAQSTIDPLVATSGALKAIAVTLTKIANDIRWMSSGPRAGMGEIELPELQPGSSIMPGKVNPVIAESLVMICAQVMGYDTAITVAGQAGNFELNVMLPVVAFDLLDGMMILASGVRNFAHRAIDGVKATGKGPEMVEKGLMLVTALAPVVGYDTAAAIAKEAHKSGRTIRAVALERTDLSESRLDDLLDPLQMVEPETATA